MTTEAALEEGKYKRAYWLSYPMCYVDSYGWAWALTPDCQTVCAGTIEDIRRVQREAAEASQATGKPPYQAKARLGAITDG